MTFFAGRSTGAAVSHGPFTSIPGCFLRFARRTPAEMQRAGEGECRRQNEECRNSRSRRGSGREGGRKGEIKNAECGSRSRRDSGGVREEMHATQPYHFLNPRNVGEVKDADGVGEVGAAAFGDVMKISLKVRGDRIIEARFQTFGCGTAIAASSVTTELITGRTLEEAKKFSNQEVIAALGGLPPEKVHCSMLAEEAVRAALKNYWQRQKPAGA